MEADVEAAGISLPLRWLNLVHASKYKKLLNVRPVIEHTGSIFIN
jgi:hypothetical protein